MWNDYREKIGCIDPKLKHYFPDFMIISPGKTGTTWLASNLSLHPEIYVAKQKEVKYFCINWRKFDINWYLSNFVESQINSIKGEASPTYSILPSFAIKLISEVKPDLKLIFLMREPMARAWSHAKHNYRVRTVNFYNFQGNIEDVPTSKWIENFMHIFPYSQGDYLGILHRWLRFFPKKQFYVGFFESIEKEPQLLLSQIFKFLSVKQEIEPIMGNTLSTKINEGLFLSKTPELDKILRQLFQARTAKLVTFLKEEFGLDAPSEWQNTLLGTDNIKTAEQEETDVWLALALDKLSSTLEISYCRRAIDKNPNFSWSYHKLGNLLLKLGDTDQAITAYNSALKINPNSATFHLSLGDALAKKGLVSEANAHYQTAIELKPDLPLVQAELELMRSLKHIISRASSTQEEIYGPQNLFWGDVMIWHSQSPPQYPEWLEFELPQPQKWHGISIKPQQRHYERAPSTFTMMGSNDKQQWESLLSVSNYKWVSDNWQQWNFESSNEYKYYKMEILANSDNSNWLTVQRLGPIIDNIKSK